MLVRYLGQKCYHHPLFFPSSLSVFYDWFWQAFFMIRGMQNCTSAKKSWVHPLNEPLNYETVRRSLLHYSLSEKSEGSEKAIKKGYYFYLLLSSSAILSSSSKESALPLQRLYLLLCFLLKVFKENWHETMVVRKILLNKQMSNFKSNRKNWWIWICNIKSYEALFKNVKWICVLVHKLNSTLGAPAVIIAITAKFSYFT